MHSFLLLFRMNSQFPIEMSHLKQNWVKNIVGGKWGFTHFSV